MDHVLVGLDYSDPSVSALKYALKKFPDTKLTVVHVIESIHPFVSIEWPLDSSDIALTHERESAKQLLENATHNLAQDRDIQTVIARGDPAQEIVTYAEDYRVDLVVLGTHGRTKLTRFFLGSVIEDVIRRSPAPVMIVRQNTLP